MSTSSPHTVADPVLASTAKRSLAGSRLRRHADYQRVYKEGRKQSSPSMSYFFRSRVGDDTLHGPRVGLTAGRVLGKAVARNRIKRRIREAARLHLDILRCDVDLVLHPRRSVLQIEFDRLERELARIFSTVAEAVRKQAAS